MAFGYPSLYANGLNNNTQIRRATDMVYQRGGTYGVTLTGDTYEPSMELVVNLFADDELVGQMAVVPYQIEKSGTYPNVYYSYNFNVRPYSYLQNYVQSQHYQYYWLNDWYSTTQQINWNNPYPNSVKANFTYQYRYLNNGVYVGQTGTTNYNHYTQVPTCATSTGFTASGFTNTGEYFDYVGGQFQFDNNFILQNFDQELGTVIGTGLTINTVDRYRSFSPMSQFLMDYPSVPEMSETARFLTNAPRIQSIQSDENLVLYYLNGQTGDRMVIEADYAVFEFYDVNNNQVDYFEQQLNFSGTTYASPTDYTDTLQIFALPCGPADITNIFATINWSQVAYYRVQLFYALPTDNILREDVGPVGPVSEAFYFYVEENCQPENTRLVWLNANGGYDYYTFTSYRQDTKKITRQTYDNRYYSTDLSSPDRNIGRTVKTFDTKVDTEMVLETDWINVQQGKWLQELFMSPQVYEMKPDFISEIDRQDKVYKDLTPLQVLSTEVETITKKHRKLNKYRITVKTASSYFVNRGF